MNNEKEYYLNTDVVVAKRDSLFFSALYISSMLNVSAFEYYAIENNEKTISESQLTLLSNILNLTKNSLILSRPKKSLTKEKTKEKINSDSNGYESLLKDVKIIK